ncbi:MAG: MFS transporter [Deltaproteobacteria bacterium]|nr:MFS transporter [Deltaproteobacteria bacterium]
MRYRWVMLGLVWLLYAAFGVVSRSMAPLVTPVLRDLNISYSQMGLILGSWPLTYVAVALVSGAVIDRWGIHKSLFIGILIIGLSEVLRYFANGFVTMFLCVAMFGLGGPMISVGSPKTISQWFRGKERATAVGVYMTAPWTGSLIAYSITNSVVMPLTGYSWRLTFVVLSSLAFAAALLWWFLARDVERTEATERTGIAEVFTGLIDIRNVRRILLMGFLAFAVGHGFNDWLPKILETGGLSPAIAGFAASIPLLIGIPTVLFLPRSVAPRLRGRIVSFLSLGIAIALGVVVTGSGSRLIGGLVFYGLCYSSVTPLLLLVLMDMPEVGSRYMGSAAGLYFCISEIGGFAGPFIVGAIKDLTGSFFAGAFFFVAVELAVAIMAFSLKIQPASDTKTS